MTLALADASDITTLPPLWVLVVIAAAILALVVSHLARHAPEQEPETSRLDRADGLGRCQQRTCPGPAMFTVTDDEGHSRRVCGACFELGWRLGWWVSFADHRPYDQEASA